MSKNAAISKDFYQSSVFKLTLLICMTLQNSTTVLVGRYTQSSVPKEDMYNVNHLIVVCEIGKLLLSFLFEHFSSNGKLISNLRANIIDRPYDAMKIVIPALLYLVQNSLLYVALANLTAPMFQVTYQGKLVTTAIVSVAMLNRKYNLQQWVCLVVISLGVSIVVLGEKKAENKVVTGHQSLSVGLLAVTVACLCSAFAGVYFEKVVKGNRSNNSSEGEVQVSVWMRNIQLAFFSVWIALAQGFWQSIKNEEMNASSDATPKAYFHGFTGWVWFLVLLQSGGGLLVAAVIKYADNVLKGLATGVSVCLSTGASNVIFKTNLSGQFSVGAVMILTSVYLFSNPLPFPYLVNPKMKVDDINETKGEATVARTVSGLTARGTPEKTPILPK